MKSTFIYFGILVAMISNTALGNGLAKEQNHQENSTDKFKKPDLELESDTLETMTAIYKKTIEEVIAEDNRIIESEIETNAFSAIEKRIEEDNQIIESNITDKVFPLDASYLEGENHLKFNDFTLR